MSVDFLISLGVHALCVILICTYSYLITLDSLLFCAITTVDQKAPESNSLFGRTNSDHQADTFFLLIRVAKNYIHNKILYQVYDMAIFHRLG